MARLPQKMLAHPKGGALAVVGHVDRAWSFSFSMDQNASLGSFKSAFETILAGSTLGAALEYFNERYAQFSSVLTEKIAQNDWDPVDPRDLAFTWTANNDAKNYVVLGDPAVRAMVAKEPADQPAAVKPLEFSSAAPAQAPAAARARACAPRLRNPRRPR